ncbi:MAG: FAD-binding oxidoreductase, partial [Clostridia bacterium]
MSTEKQEEFYPEWYTETPPEKSYRSIFKWGDPNFNKAPKKRLYKVMKQIFNMTDEDFRSYQKLGLEEVKFDSPCKLSTQQVEALTAIVGKENVACDDYSRLSVAYGKTMFDLLRLRSKIVENIPDIVLYPENKEQIKQIVAYVSKEKIALYVYGGGSSVT